MWTADSSHNEHVCVCVYVCMWTADSSHNERVCVYVCVWTGDSYFFYIKETDTVKCSSYDKLS
jgi:hypothetical protein